MWLLQRSLVAGNDSIHCIVHLEDWMSIMERFSQRLSFVILLFFLEHYCNWRQTHEGSSGINRLLLYIHEEQTFGAQIHLIVCLSPFEYHLVRP